MVVILSHLRLRLYLPHRGPLRPAPPSLTPCALHLHFASWLWTSLPWCSTKSSDSYSNLNSLLFPNTRSSCVLHFCYTTVIQLVIQVWLLGPSLISHLWLVSGLCAFLTILLQSRLSSSVTGTVSSFPCLFLATWMLLFPIFGAVSRVTFLRCGSHSVSVQFQNSRLSCWRSSGPESKCW